MDHVRIFDKKRVTLEQEIGSGNFGRVHKGKIKSKVFSV